MFGFLSMSYIIYLGFIGLYYPGEKSEVVRNGAEALIGGGVSTTDSKIYEVEKYPLGLSPSTDILYWRS